MVPAGMYVDRLPPGRIRLRRRPDVYTLNDLTTLETKSDRPDVQRFLRAAIREGLIRVCPESGAPDRVRITRTTVSLPDPAPVRRL
jgi:hypothetical protein